MRSKRDWGWALVGALLLIIGASFLWSGESGLLYHAPIYFKGQSWVDPWQAIIGGAFLCGLGLFLVANSLRKKKEDDQHNP